MKIGVIVAMDKEFVQLRGILSGAHEEQVDRNQFVVGDAGGKEVVLQKCGIGKVNAAVGTVEMIHAYHPDIIISTGCAGGADTSLAVTDVVVGTHYVFHDVYCGSEVAYGQMVGMPAEYIADARLVETALRLDCKETVRQGLMVSGDWFVDSREKMREILGHFPEAVAVDMESCAIAQVCHLYQVPFVSFRIISDVPLSDHKAEQYFDFWSTMANGSFYFTRAFIQSITDTQH